ncbi:hypothetical protein I8742_04460 [Escherichia coli]|uniref:hypothetical protein n=1 Tax=Escherichia coli TaxID=562 RepID=UPI001902F956|nr:hypothetical protein [Escherichia coli]MBK0800491.1 hypothetical protein [Escherichia coli]MBS8314197.1 hypothetical protein [Escherichia coli]MBS8349456.1 hypothetical protein [Escherichia coli]MBS8400705.1 hypothetical protein [Escherichia coli]MCE2417624.1 hypothetical protein [Escherichia coli]
MEKLECNASNHSPVWGVTEFIFWKLAPKKWGGGVAFGRYFKDGWVKHNCLLINAAANAWHLPAPLLAGVCWIEVGGDPQIIDTLAFEFRAMSWSGPEWVDEHITIASKPEKTSFGAVSMQLRTAARTLGLDETKMDNSQLRELANCLQHDVFNIQLAARHLYQLAEKDGFQVSLPHLTKEQIRIIGARYNRGVSLSLEKIKEDTSYGDFIINNWLHFSSLLITTWTSS